MSVDLVRFHGRVVREAHDRGSKSERKAVLLKTDAGLSYVLRKKGGPAFGDASLDPLVGTSICAQGVLVGATLILQNWEKDD